MQTTSAPVPSTLIAALGKHFYFLGVEDGLRRLLWKPKKSQRSIPKPFSPLVSLIDCYVVQLSQVFMLRVFPFGTNY